MFSYLYSISVSSDFNITQVSVFMGSNKSATEFTVPVDGSVLFVIDQLNYPESYGAKTISVDLRSEERRVGKECVR